MYDLVTLGKKGVNWAANLNDYNRILNNECKEELGWKTPFEIYYGRKSYLLVKVSLECVDSDGNDVITSTPRKRELASYRKNVKKIQDRAKLYSTKLNDWMVRRHKRLHKAENFKLKDNVLIRYRPQKGVASHQKRDLWCKALLLRRNNDTKYQIATPCHQNEIGVTLK